MPCSRSAGSNTGLGASTGRSTSPSTRARGHRSCWVSSGVWQFRHSQRFPDLAISAWYCGSTHAWRCTLTDHSPWIARWQVAQVSADRSGRPGISSNPVAHGCS